ncbi:MAG: hypothetical protein JWN13_2129 [Betaproteobacteria bacterium]|jgi:hypothetical protein|nr:hypothetical protein [Betaproteobacteria bacterium]
MDELVLRGLAKWPDVPAVYGWLTLDRRGNWLIKGSPIGNETITAFIGRNYERDGRGRWFFQNGPQRVYVALEYTPFVYRAVNGDDAVLAIESHTGSKATLLSGAWIDETGALLLETEHGIGVVHDRDLEKLVPSFIDVNGAPLPEDTLDQLMELLQQGRPAPIWIKYGESNVRVEPLQSHKVAEGFGFDARPIAPEGEAKCA